MISHCVFLYIYSCTVNHEDLRACSCCPGVCSRSGVSDLQLLTKLLLPESKWRRWTR